MKRPRLFVFILLLLLAASLSLYWAKRPGLEKRHISASKQAKVLYWYDPMRPDQHFDKPGKSPYMDMDLVPKLADEGKTNASVKIDPSAMQNLGVRVAKVERIALASSIEVSGLIGFDERDVAVVQSRANGFVVKVSPLAPGDVVHRGEALVTLSVPEWSAAQGEFLAAQGDPALLEAARERLRLSGMPEAYISETGKTRKANLEFTLRSPVSGVIQSLDIRTGMSVSPGQTLVRINGLSTVWLDAAVPQALSGEVHVGDKIEATIAGLPEKHPGQVEAVLPVLNDTSRSLRVRIAFPNQDMKLRPGDSAQVRIGHMTNETALAVPLEAVIRTGKRSLVMVSDGKGRFVPAEVVPGQEIGNRVVILSGLQEGQKIASSGQFLIDSEASLSGVMARSLPEKAAKQKNVDEADATIVKLSGNEVTLKHGPLKSFDMPAMTMSYALANPEVAKGLKSGDRVHVMVRKTDQGMVVEKISKMGNMGGMP